MENIGELSCHGWADNDNVSGDHCIVAKSETNFPFIIFMDDSNPVGTDLYDFLLQDFTTEAIFNRVSSSTATAIINTWQAVTARWKRNTSGETIIYVNGTSYTGNAPATTFDDNNLDNTVLITIGATGSTRRMTGDIGEVGLWSVQLTINEIEALQHGIPPFIIRH